jgi:hypothetical protein
MIPQDRADGYLVIVDVAKLHFGDMAYLGIKEDGTVLIMPCLQIWLHPI